MNELGIHCLVLVPDWSPASREYAIRKTAELGYDFIEVVMFDPRDIASEDTARIAAQHGIKLTCGMTLNVDADLSSDDPDIAARGETLVVDAIAATRDMGSPLLGGVTYSALHRYLEPAGQGAYDRVIEAYGRIVEKATAADVRVGLEPVNRYESRFINTVGQAAGIIQAVGSDQLFVQMDTYHMSIEETDMAGALEAVAPFLGYAHIGDTNRGPLGAGSFDFKSFFATLSRIGYTGGLTFESFSPEVVSSEVTSVLALWRRPWQDAEATARAALRFLRNGIESATESRSAFRAAASGLEKRK